MTSGKEEMFEVVMPDQSVWAIPLEALYAIYNDYVESHYDPQYARSYGLYAPPWGLVGPYMKHLSGPVRGEDALYADHWRRLGEREHERMMGHFGGMFF